MVSLSRHLAYFNNLRATGVNCSAQMRTYEIYNDGQYQTDCKFRCEDRNIQNIFYMMGYILLVS